MKKIGKMEEGKLRPMLGIISYTQKIHMDEFACFSYCYQ